MEEIKNKSTAMQKYFQDLEKDIINVIIKRLDKIANVKADDLTTLLKLQNISDDIRAIKKKIAETLDKGKTEIYNIVTGCAREYYDELAEKYKGQLAPFEQNQKMLRLVERTKWESVEQFAQSLKFETLGFENSNSDFKFLEQAYREIMNAAAAKITQKDEDFETFIETALENLAERGLLKYGD